MGRLSDKELLSTFVARRDATAESAFALLVERHGPMVLGVCRRVLRDRQEAEDAFQATFLVLARKAAAIAQPEHLASWLHGVAGRVALDAHARSLRLRRRERNGHELLASRTSIETGEQTFREELRTILDQELGGLPESYRSALVLCELEGITRRAAALRLGIPAGTLSSRLARGKDLLRRRLARRGLALSAIVLESALSSEVRACMIAMPPSLRAAAMRAALRIAARASLAEAASSSVAALARGALRSMLLPRLKLIAVAPLALAAMIAGAGVLAQAPAQSDTPAASTSLKGMIAVARPAGRVKQIVLPGSVAFDPARLARIRARFTPARVVELGEFRPLPGQPLSPKPRALRVGDPVRKGNVLAVIDIADLASRKTDLVEALLQLELDQRILDKISQNRAAVPEIRRLEQQRAVQAARNAINRALNSLKAWEVPQDEIDALRDEARKRLGEQEEGNPADKPGRKAASPDVRGMVTLRAQFDGVVVERNIHQDELLTDNTVNLFQIADPSRLIVTANCPEDSLLDVSRLRGGEQRWVVRAAGTGSEALTGGIEEVGFTIDPQQRTAVIKGYVENPGQRLRAGQYVTVTLTLRPPDDLVEVPADAIIEADGQSSVFVQTDPGGRQFTLRPVEVTERQGGKAVVRELRPGEHERPSEGAKESGPTPPRPLGPGDHILRYGELAPAGQRLDALEHKLDRILDALRDLRPPDVRKSVRPRDDSRR
jgi:RNA polymerase sigma factor (sigma-70 family)